MALLPEAGATDADYNGDGFWGNNGAEERLPLRGGSWVRQARSGVFALNLDNPRSLSAGSVGCRTAFENL